MIPILFSRSETDYDTFGEGALADCAACEVTESKDGWAYTCVVKYPVNGHMFHKIVPGQTTILALTHNGTQEPFDVVSMGVGLDGIATFTCQHVSYRLSRWLYMPNNYPEPSDATDVFNTMPKNSYFNAIVPGNATFEGTTYRDGWNYTNSQPGARPGSTAGTGYPVRYPVRYPRSVRDVYCGAENSIQTKFGYEFGFNRFCVNIYPDGRGIDRGVVIRYSSNLTGMSYECDKGGMYDAVIPYWIDSQTGRCYYLDGDETFGEHLINYDTVGTGGNMDTVELGQTFEAVPLDISSMLDNAPDAWGLLSVADEWAVASAIKQPYENLTVNFRTLADGPQILPYDPAIEKLLLCDYATVIMPEYGLAKTMKCVKIVFDALNEIYISVEMGETRRTIFTADSRINTAQTDDEEEAPVIWEGEMDIEPDPYNDDPPPDVIGGDDPLDPLDPGDDEPIEEPVEEA